MAELTKQALRVENNTEFPNNNNGAITPSNLRGFNLDMIDSTVNQAQYNTDSGSWNQQIDALESFSGSTAVSITNLNASSASQQISINNLNAFSASASGLSTGSLLITASAVSNVITFTKGDASTFNVTVADTTDLTPLNTFTASAAISITNLNASSASQQVSINNLNTTSASLLVETQNLELFSASALVSISNLNASSASQQISINALNVSSASQQVSIDSLNSKTGSYATTGSNIFVGANTFTSISASSFVSASEFIGNGSKITGITASIALPILDEGIPQGNAFSMNFTGSAISAIVVGGTAVVSVNVPDTGSFNSLTASFNSYTASTNADLAAIHQATASLQLFTASFSTSSLVSTSSFNAYTSSNNQRVSSLEAATSSYATSAITASSIITASVNNDDITFTKGDGSQFTIQVATGSFALSASYAETASFALNGGVTQILAGPNITVSPLSGKGQVTISSTGTGSGNFNTATGSYGSFYDTTIQTNLVANAANSMSFNETAITNGVSISGSTSPFNTYIKTENAGIYNLQFSAQVDKTDSGTDEIDIWIRKNGIDLLDTATKLTLTNNNTKVVAAWNWFVQSAANDYYQLIWASADTSMRLFAEPSSSTHPGIPSVIATANRVDQFLSNTGSFSGSFTGTFNGYNLTEFTTTSSFNSYTSSTDSRLTNIESTTASLNTSVTNLNSATASLFTSASLGLVTASFSGNTLTFTKGDATTFGVVIPDVSGSTINTGSFATTGSNNFVGDQIITGSLILSSSNAVELSVIGNSVFTGSTSITGALSITPISLPNTFPAGGTAQFIIPVLSGSNNVFARDIDNALYWSPAFNQLAVSASTGNSNITPGSVSATNSSANNSTLNATRVSNRPVAGKLIGISGDPSLASLFGATTTNPAIVLESGSAAGGEYYTPIEFQSSQSFSDGRVTFTRNVAMLENLEVTGSLTASLQQGYVWVGDASGRTTTVATSSFGGGGTINTGSFATTGSNSFVGNQTITGSVIISSSAAIDLEVRGTMRVTGSLAGQRTAMAPDGVFSFSGSSQSNMIAGNFNNTNGVNAQYITTGFGGVIGNFSESDFTEIGLALDGNEFTTNWANGPILYVNNTTGDTYEGVFGFQNKTNYTDGRITALKPLDVRGNTTITGSLILSSSAATELFVIGNAVITGSLILSSSAATELQVIGNSVFTGSVAGNVVSASITSNTASIDFNLGNYFEITSSVTPLHLNVTNISPGRTSTLIISASASSSITFSPNVAQPSGSAYSGSLGSIDILSLIAFNSSKVNLVATKALI